MKGKILLTTSIILTGSFVFGLFIKIGELRLKHIWFSLALVCIGLYSLVYSYMYNLDSITYFGVLVIAFAFATAIRFLTMISFNNFYPIYFICFAVAHFAVYVLFRQFIHFKVFAFFLIESILLITYKLKFLSFLELTSINVEFLIIVAINVAIRLKKNLRRE